MLFKISLQNYDFSFVISVTFDYNFATFSTLEKKLAVKAKRFTKAAQEKIEALGGKTEVI